MYDSELMVTIDQAGAGIRSIRVATPSRALRPRIQYLWIDEPETTDTESSRARRIVPDPCAHVLYHRIEQSDGSGFVHRLVLVGPRSVAVDIDRRGRRVTAGARLQPWALPALFDVAAIDLTDMAVPLRDVMGDDAASLVDQLAGSAPENVPCVLERCLTPAALRIGSRAERRARSAMLMLRASGACDSATDELGISQRRLRSIMLEQIGFGPRTLMRISRLHATLERVRVASRDASWAAIAARSGYADQSHLIREFRQFLGETPRAWRRRSQR